jgi:hypothetical protein
MSPEPYDFSAEHGTFAWFRGPPKGDGSEDDRKRRATLRPHVFDCLSGERIVESPNSQVAMYPTREAAEDARVQALEDGEFVADLEFDDGEEGQPNVNVLTDEDPGRPSGTVYTQIDGEWVWGGEWEDETDSDPQ